MDLDEVCRFGWFDGEESHVCRQTGAHDGHKCQYCGAKHDPNIRVVEDRRGGLMAVRAAGTSRSIRTAGAG